MATTDKIQINSSLLLPRETTSGEAARAAAALLSSDMTITGVVDTFRLTPDDGQYRIGFTISTSATSAPAEVERLVHFALARDMFIDEICLGGERSSEVPF